MVTIKKAGAFVGLLFALFVSGAAPAATVNGGTITIARGAVQLDASGASQIQIVYSGTTRSWVTTLYVDAAGAHVIDGQGNVIATPAPPALMTAITAFTTQLDSLIATGAAGGKLNP